MRRLDSGRHELCPGVGSRKMRASSLLLRMAPRVVARLLGLVAILLVWPASADPQPDRDSQALEEEVPRPEARQVYDLKRCLELAERNYPKIHEALAKLSRRQAELLQARTAPYSDFTLTAGIGPAPTVRGISSYSPNTDVTLSSNMGLAWQLGLEGTLPLYTFGKLEHLLDAARAGVEAGRHEVAKEKNELRLAVRRAYYGAQLARDARELVGEALRQIDRLLDTLARKVSEGDADDVQLLKARIYRAELVARQSEVRRQEQVALAALRALTGVSEQFQIPDQPLARSGHVLRPLSVYLTAARLHRPEVNQVRAGVAAKRAQLELERSRFYPDLGLTLSWRWARAPEVDDQRNPFVRDPANYHYYGFGFGLRWKLDFLPQVARYRQAEADLEQMRALERFAVGGVGLEVEQAFEEARDAERRVEAYGRAVRYARQWLLKVQQGIDVGTRDEEDIVEPAKEYALKRFSLMTATLDYNLALARLAQATGWERLVGE